MNGFDIEIFKCLFKEWGERIFLNNFLGFVYNG